MLEEDEIVDMLDWCNRHCRASQEAFIHSLQEYWELNGKLTVRQQECLQKIYDQL